MKPRCQRSAPDIFLPGNIPAGLYRSSPQGTGYGTAQGCKHPDPRASMLPVQPRMATKELERAAKRVPEVQEPILEQTKESDLKHDPRG